MSTLAFFDWETFSLVDLTVVGTYAYAAHPSTRATCAYVEIGDHRVFWTPEQMVDWAPPPGVGYAYGIAWMHALFANPDLVFIGHNAPFDAAIAEITYGLPARRWFDTLAISDYLGYPGSLDGVGSHLYGKGKDKAGYRLMMALCKPGRGGKMPTITRDDLTALCIYNMRDIELTRRYFTDFFTKMPACEQPVYDAHVAINRRGVPIDMEFVRGLDALNREIVDGAGRMVTEATAGILGPDGKPASLCQDDLTRVEFLQGWINGQLQMTGGGSIDSCDEDTMSALLAGPDEYVRPHVKAAIQARLSSASASVHKLRAMMHRASPDNRLRGEYRLLGAGTGRWKSLGVQIHNLPRPHPMFMSDANSATFRDGSANPWHSDAIIDQIREAAVTGNLGKFLQVAHTVEEWRKAHVAQLGIKDPVTIPDCFKAVVRPCFIPSPGKRLVGADFSSIEGRGAAWLAGDEPILQAYRDYDAGNGPDLYCVMASAIFGRTITKKDKIERQTGKAAELGCCAAETRVLTSRGVKRIVDVRGGDLVWDGERWVTTGGCIPKGTKAVISWHGTHITPDHLILIAPDTWAPVGSLSPDEDAAAALLAAERGPEGERFAARYEHETTLDAVPVFDLLNCGPDHRFMVITDDGPRIIHNCTYQMGANKFGSVGNNAAELAAAGVTPQQVVDAWRSKHRITAKYWKQLDTAMKLAISDTRGRTHSAGPLTFSYAYNLMKIALPCGRDLSYHEPTSRPSPRFEGATEVVYNNYRRGEGEYATMTLSGGKLLENCWAGDTLVVTQRGTIPIVEVSAGDRVWDGVEWVTTDGCSASGEQEVGAWLNCRVTPNHLIYDGRSWNAAISMDAVTTARSLAWARASMPSPFVEAPQAPRFAAHVYATVDVPFSVSRRKSGRVRHGRARIALAKSGLSSEAFASASRLSFAISASAKRGNTGTPAWSAGAATPPMLRIRTTARGGFAYATSGYPTEGHSIAMRSLSQTGTLPDSTLTGFEMGRITNRATSTLSPGRGTSGTSELTASSHIKGNASCSLSSHVGSAPVSQATSLFHTTSTEAGPRSGSWTAITGRVPVYDLKNCGPRSRFMILTDAGPVVVHNCTQAICRDLLALKLVECEQAQLPVVMHTHDELNVEVDAADAPDVARWLGERMETPPDWAEGFPMKGEPNIMERYGK